LKKSEKSENENEYPWKEMGWVGAILVILGYYLNANQNIYCWPCWMMGNVLVGLYCMSKEAYSAAVMSFILIILNIYGYLNWLDKS
jgi:hypothetical protein